jgi:hypothetical protein
MQAWSITVLLLMFAAFPPDTKLSSRNGSVVIRPTKSSLSRGALGHILEFTDANNKLLCSIDYSSDDDHGYEVVKAEWTHNQRYFVWSLQSLGGHSPWHFPTQAFDSRNQRVYLLDDLANGPGLGKGDFKLKDASTFESRAYEGNRRFIFDLADLSKLPPTGNEFHCGGGHTIQLGDRTH